MRANIPLETNAFSRVISELLRHFISCAQHCQVLRFVANPQWFIRHFPRRPNPVRATGFPANPITLKDAFYGKQFTAVLSNIELIHWMLRC